MSRSSVLQPKHGVFHQQLHGVQRVKKLPVVAQIVLLQAVVSGLSIQPRLVITVGLQLAILHKISTHR